MRLDLYKHMAVGAASVPITLLIIAISRKYGDHAAAVTGAILLGMAYEFLQWVNKEGDPDPVDAAVTALGGIFVVAFTGGAGYFLVRLFGLS